MEMFEKAVRMKLRLDTDRGRLDVYDLWDLNLRELNKLAKSLNKEIKEIEEEDFLEVKNESNTTIKLTFEIVLHILNVKKSEQEQREKAAERKAAKQRILEIISNKENEELQSMSKEDLLKKLDELD